MAGINSTGTSSSSNYVIGRGCVFISILDSNNNPVAWRELGNAPDFEVEADTSVIEHFSSKNAARVKDAEVISEISLDFSLTLEELTFDNYSEFFLGKAGTYLEPSGNAGGAPYTGDFTFPVLNGTSPDPQPSGRHYGIYFDGTNMFVGTDGSSITTHAQKLYGLDPAQMTITSPGTSTTFTVAGGDFTYDPISGDIFVPFSDSTPGALDFLMFTEGVAVGTDGAYATMEFEYGDAFGGGRYEQIEGLVSAQRNVALKFIQLNGNLDGEAIEIVLHRAKLRPQGTLSFINDEDFGQLPLEGALESNEAYDSTGGGFITIRRIQAPV